MDNSDNQLTYGEFIELDDITTINRDNITGDFNNICTIVSELTGRALDEVAAMDEWSEHINDKALYFTPVGS